MKKIEEIITVEIREIAAKYAEIIKELIPPEDFGDNLEDFVVQHYIDSVFGTVQAPIEEKQIDKVFEEQGFIPAILIYRDVENPLNTPRGGEFLARRWIKGEGLSTPGDWIMKMSPEHRKQLNLLDLEFALKLSQAIPDFQSSSNLSVALIEDDECVSRISDLLAELEIKNPTNITLEISEDTKSLEGKADRIQGLIDLGFHISLDDCGKGNTDKIYEELCRANIPLHSLKIADSITADLMDGRPQELTKWMKRANEHPSKPTLVFEGGPKIVPQPKVLKEIQKIASALDLKDVKLWVQGPIFENV